MLAFLPITSVQVTILVVVMKASAGVLSAIVVKGSVWRIVGTIKDWRGIESVEKRPVVARRVKIVVIDPSDMKSLVKEAESPVDHLK